MGKSFVLKSAAGKPVGFLQQIEGRVRCRIHADDNQMEILLCFAAGECVSKPVEEAGIEYEWDVGSNTLLGACLTSGGQRIADTGETARRRAAEYACRLAAMAVPREPEPAGNQREQTEKQDERRWPQRRWPPHPCLMQTRYENGAWNVDGASDPGTALT